jgi:hypothetical protein
MMFPQTQYVMSAPAMQMPMQSYPMLDSGCCDDCGSDCGGGGDMGSMMPSAEFMQGTEMMPGSEYMQGTSYPDINSGSGCCGADNGFPQSGFESGTPAVPQSTMLMVPGSMPMSQMTMRQPHNIAPYTSMSRWYSNPGYSTAGTNLSYRQSMPTRQTYGTAMYRQPQSANRVYNSAMRPTPQSTGWQTVQMRPQQFQAMPSQRAMSPLIGGTMPGTVYARPMVAGDIRGDHELAGPSSSAVSIVPNSFNGRPPIQQASWSQPARTTTARRYPNSIQ